MNVELNEYQQYNSDIKTQASFKKKKLKNIVHEGEHWTAIVRS